MKQKIVNGRWVLWTTDDVANWDGGTGDYASRNGWEFERFESFRQELVWGDTFFDVGAEHGWISAIIGREFVGAANMVLFEPGVEFWGSIRKVWHWNGLDTPLDCFSGFVDAKTVGRYQSGIDGWPAEASVSSPEIGGMPYNRIGFQDRPSITIDDYVKYSGHKPTAINVDVEGAELLVMQGASQTLLNCRPLVWISIHPDLIERDFGATKETVLGFMRGSGYTGTHLGTDHEEHWLFKPRCLHAA